MPDLTNDLTETQGGRYQCPFCDARRGLSFDPGIGESGVGYCFSCQWGGDGVELYAEVRNTDLAAALDAYGIDRSGLRQEAREKEENAPHPTTPEYTDEEWKERCRAWQAMNTEELRLRADYRARRVRAQENRDQDEFDRWQRRLDDLFDHVLRREMIGQRKTQRLDANTAHLE